jgi:metallo-beta-lactamase class B
MSVNRIVALVIAAIVPAGIAAAQAPAEKPDSAEVTARIARIKKNAGPAWSEAVHFFCEAPRANSASDPRIEPTKIFDNVYVIGNEGTVAYVIRTSAGLLMIDALGANQVETQLLPGFAALGLNPADVKTIVVGHGHADHFGGAPYMQEHFGSKVYISAADWDLMEHPPAGRGGRGPGPVLP